MPVLDIQAASGKNVVPCPNCVKGTLVTIEIVDKEFGARNELTDPEVTDIAEDGLFEMYACTDCGFKWVRNPNVCTTSQIFSTLVPKFAEFVLQLNPIAFDNFLYELRSNNYISPADIVFIVSPLSFDMKKTRLIVSLIRALKSLPSDVLVEMYNAECGTSGAAENYVEAVDNMHSAIEAGVKSSTVLTDD